MIRGSEGVWSFGKAKSAQSGRVWMAVPLRVEIRTAEFTAWTTDGALSATPGSGGSWAVPLSAAVRPGKPAAAVGGVAFTKRGANPTVAMRVGAVEVVLPRKPAERRGRV